MKLALLLSILFAPFSVLLGQAPILLKDLNGMPKEGGDLLPIPFLELGGSLFLWPRERLWGRNFL